MLRRSPRRRLRAHRQLLPGVDDEVRQQFVAARDVPVERGAGHPELLGDRIQGEPLDPVLRELAQGRALDLLARPRAQPGAAVGDRVVGRAVVAALLSFRLIADSRAEVEHRSFDLPGAATVTAGLTAAVYAIVEAESVGWTSTTTLAVSAAAVVLLGTFVAIERRALAPLVPFGIFRLRTIAGANVTMFLVGAAMFGLFYFLSLSMQQVLGYSALKTGLAQLPLAGVLVVAAGVVSPLVTRLGSKPVTLAGLVTFAAGLAWFSRMPADADFVADLLGPSLVVGVGLAATFVSLTVSAVEGIADTESGLASGLINTTQQIGGALGLAVLSAIATGRTDSVAGEVGPAIALNEGFQAGLLVAGGIVLVAVVLSAVVSRGSRPAPAVGPSGTAAIVHP